MGTTNAKTVARSEETSSEPDSISGGGEVTGGKSKNFGSEQERNHRANSSKSNIFSPGTAVAGGTLDHLIDDYEDQVAAREEDLKRIGNEINRLKTRIQEFKSLREELKKQSEEHQE